MTLVNRLQNLQTQGHTMTREPLEREDLSLLPKGTTLSLVNRQGSNMKMAYWHLDRFFILPGVYKFRGVSKPHGHFAGLVTPDGERLILSIKRYGKDKEWVAYAVC